MEIYQKQEGGPIYVTGNVATSLPISTKSDIIALVIAWWHFSVWTKTLFLFQYNFCQNTRALIWHHSMRASLSVHTRSDVTMSLATQPQLSPIPGKSHPCQLPRENWKEKLGNPRIQLWYVYWRDQQHLPGWLENLTGRIMLVSLLGEEW